MSRLYSFLATEGRAKARSVCRNSRSSQPITHKSTIIQMTPRLQRDIKHEVALPVRTTTTNGVLISVGGSIQMANHTTIDIRRERYETNRRHASSFNEGIIVLQRW